MKLYSPPNNHKLSKILKTAAIYQQQIQYIQVAYDNKNKAFENVYPNCRMPAFQTQQGGFLFGEHTIMRYLAPQQSCPFEEAQINQWLQIVEKQIDPLTGALILAQKNYQQITQDKKKKAIQGYNNFIKIVDQRLKIHSFLVGNRLTIADISIFSNIKSIIQSIPTLLNNAVHTKRWYTLIDQNK